MANPDASPARRLALLGGESSGKTTLARALAAHLHTAWVPEYGRELWERLRHTLSVEELLHVARHQVELEDAAAAQREGWIVCDTTPLTTLQYCLHDHGTAPPELHALARRVYDLTVVCAPDFDFVQDGCRRDDSFRQAQHAWAVAQLQAQGVLFLTVSGPVAERVAQVLARLRQLPAPPFTPHHKDPAMSVHEILKMGDPRLLRVAQPVLEFGTPELKTLIADMFETMAAANGAGLAAPQIGVDLQLVIFGYTSNVRYPEAPPVPPTVLINPVITPLDDEVVNGWEGCLSVPGLRGVVPRHARIRYAGFDPDGRPIEREADGFHARVVQHECDHLIGRLYPTRMTDLTQFGYTSVLFPDIAPDADD